jgi:hypothetical protein
MKSVLFILLILITCHPGIMAQSGGKSTSLKPTGYQKKVTTKVEGKLKSYYSLSAETPSVITLVGPGKLKVNTRGRFKPGEGTSIKYEVLYTVDGGEQKSMAYSGVQRSKNATYENGALGVPSQLNSFDVELGRGNHTIAFKLKDNTVSVACRYVFTPTREKKQDWISYSPKLPSEPVDLISGESTTSYYRFSKEKPLKIEINGPTELRVLTRLENHFEMKGRIHYRLQVKELDKVVNTYQLSSERSETAVYKENKELVPGKACEFVIIVPKGNHTYVITPLDEDKNTVLGRLLLLKKDVELEN